MAIKLKKSDTNGIVVTDESDEILHLIKTNVLYIGPHPRNSGAVVISSTPTTQDENEGIVIVVNEVTTVGERSFSGNRNELLRLMDELFSDGGGNGSTGLQLIGVYTSYSDLVSETSEQQIDENALAVVSNSTGVLYVNRRVKGMYRYVGGSWEWIGAVPLQYVEEQENGALAYNNTKVYFIGNLVYREGQLLRCITNIDDAKPFNAEDWEVVYASAFWTATFSEEDDTYYYYGGINGFGQWQMNRYEKSSGLRKRATNDNNGTTTSLEIAINNYKSLNYEGN